MSAGIVGEDLLLDLCYEEDAKAEVDFNVVMTGSGDLVEVQGTAEGRAFSRQQLDALIDRYWLALVAYALLFARREALQPCPNSVTASL